MPARSTPPKFSDLPDLCTVEDATAFLQCGRTTTYELVKSGALPHVKFGKLIRIPKTALLPNGNGHERG